MICTSGIFKQLGQVLIFFCALTAAGQQRTPQVVERASGNALNSQPTAMVPTPDEIIRNFIVAETRFREMMIQFSFKREVVLQTIGPQGEVTGEYLRNSIFVLDDHGQRIERVLYHPKPTIREITITKEDIQDLAGSQLFGLELSDLNSYELSYTGEACRGGRLLYVIAARPLREPDPRRMRSRFFVGRFWIDAASYQPVYVEGITEPHGKQRFLSFTTARHLQIEDLRFPSETNADDILRFPNKNVHYRIKVNYSNFKRFAGRVKIVAID